jgi:hypothetical protein
VILIRRAVTLRGKKLSGRTKKAAHKRAWAAVKRKRD